jgi:flagellar biosynthesis protein FlhB
MAKRPPAPHSYENLLKNFSIASLVGKVMDRVGIVGSICFVGSLFVFFYASIEQKQEIIDKWLLFKSSNCCPINTFVIIVFLIILFFFQRYHYDKIVRMNKLENERVSSERSKLQEIVLKSGLSTSRKK